VERLEARDLLSTYSLWSPTATPITASEPDSRSVEVGVQFKSDVAGTISGIRFYKGAGNTGTHVGQLFSSTGQLLASATFTAETASGWQQVNFSTPIAITANTTYVAAYHTNVGHYADDQGYFTLSALNSGPLHAIEGTFKYGSTGSFPNQIYNNSNYWVDVVFNGTTTSTPPVANAGPAKSTAEGGSVTFAGSETGGTGPFTYAWTFGDGATGTGSLTPTHVYANHGSYTATLTVTDALGKTSSASTTVTVNDVAPTANAGGPYSAAPGTALSFSGSATDPGASDAAGFTYLWDFGDNTTSTLQNPTHTYAAAGTYNVKLTVTEASGLSSTAATTANVSAVATTASLFADSVTPANPAENDPNAVELGVQFTSSIPGTISGIRFYKGAGNTGTHVGNLWSSTGQLLATATFTNESATGWQTVTFSNPVAIQANTTYVASYFTSAGFYAADQNFFATSLQSGSLTGLQGVYNYGSSSVFPNQSWNNSNYYVDVVFNPTVTGSAPVANAGPAKSTNEGGSVTFAGSETGGTGPFTYSWNFGDGTTGTGSLTPTHTYANHGAYTATLTVTDAFGRSSSSNVAVTVADVAPTANTGGPYSGVPGVAVSFNGSATDPGANDVSGCTYLWTFGDGTTSTLENPTHAYAAVGTYTATFKVTEASGLSNTASTTVTIAAASLPVANAGPAKSTPEGGSVTFAGSETGGTGPFTYAWTFGDGATGTGSLTPTHVYANHGSYTATLTVTDALGKTSSASTTVTVNDVAPTANAGGPYSAAPGAAITFSGSATDPGANDAAGFTYLWNFGDNTTSTLQNPTHTYAAAGNYTVTLKVSEASGLSGTATTTASVSSGTNAEGEPLLTSSNLQYVGAFRLPSGTVGASSFDYGGTALAFNPANNSLFLVGHDWYQNVAEVGIPSTIVDSNNVSALSTASVLQPLTDVMSRIPNNTLSGLGTLKIGGLQVINNQLVGTLYAYYDGAGAAVNSHFTLSSLNLSTAQVQGLYQVGSLGGGFVGGYMGTIPSEWQSALGASYFTGQAALNIISRTSSGPALFGFDPSKLGSSVTPITPYVYYPLANPLADISGSNHIFNGNTEIKGAVFVPGSKTVLFFGDTGTNTTGYGEPATFNDNNRTGKGWHSQNGDYAYQVWAYNVDDLIAAKNGTIQPWQVKPYSTWNIDFPNYDGGKHIGGVAFDPKTMRLYVSQQGGDTVDGQWAPLIQVYQLNLNAPGAGGQIGSVTAGSITSGADSVFAVSKTSTVTLTANNVTDTRAGTSISQVLFYLDTNGDGNLQTTKDTLLGSATQSGSTWTLNVSASSLTGATSVNGLAAGTYRVFAVAKDSDGLFSDPVEITLQVL
jgi:PKD repeat protein